MTPFSLDMRQTDLSLQDLESYFEGRLESTFPRCMLVNEVGIIARYSSEETAAAQRILVTLLASDKESDRWIAIRFLVDLQEIGMTTGETEVAIALFSTKPENRGILPKRTCMSVN